MVSNIDDISMLNADTNAIIFKKVFKYTTFSEILQTKYMPTVWSNLLIIMAW